MLYYKKLGFKAGLEVHQQLDTKKLFCSCPGITNKKESPDLIIKRKLRAVAGLSGEKDIAALHEEQKGRTFHYEFYNDCNCLIELDESPPEELNKEALEIALQISFLLKAKIKKKIKVMRKIVKYDLFLNKSLMMISPKMEAAIAGSKNSPKTLN
jgi:glutamyl-tRNA(Gln) amidotransferase subunit E